MGTDKKEVGYTSIFERNKVAKAKVVINIGGSRSSKSYSLCQLFIEKLINGVNKKIAIVRKSMPELRRTTMHDFFKLLREYGIYREDRHNKTSNTYSYIRTNGKKVTSENTVEFYGVDDPMKIKSAGYNYIWIEEADELSYDTYEIFKLRLSEPCEEGERNQLFLSLNPTDEMGWVPTKALKEADIEVIHSTFTDNPFLSEDYKKTLIDLINYDEYAYKVYALGLWGRLEGRIFTKFVTIPQLPDMVGAKWCYGLDFGVVHPSAVAKVYVKDDKLYAEECLWRSGMTVADIIEWFSHQDRGDIYADPSSKMHIKEISQAGYSCVEAHRDVLERIELCQRQTIYIPEDSTHLIKEMQGYHWRKDPRDSSHYLQEPAKYNDDAIDSMLYAAYGITERYGFATARPRISGPISTGFFSGDYVTADPYHRRFSRGSSIRTGRFN